MKLIKGNGFDGNLSNDENIVGEPDRCPFCHKSISPKFLGLTNRQFNYLEVFMACPDSSCQHSFIAYYDQIEKNLYEYTGIVSKGSFEKRRFSEKINLISPSFEKLYNEAFAAEQARLYEVCGMGYRKSLEFLIKEYLVTKKPESRDKIEVTALGNLIKNSIDHPELKVVSERAVWLGNDETHYIRKFEDKDLRDLKRLIDLTLQWIELKETTDFYKNGMK